MSTIIYPSPIFGPVHSRRLGVSLGINLLPADGKVCSFDCVYCDGNNLGFLLSKISLFSHVPIFPCPRNRRIAKMHPAITNFFRAVSFSNAFMCVSLVCQSC